MGPFGERGEIGSHDNPKRFVVTTEVAAMCFGAALWGRGCSEDATESRGDPAARKPLPPRSGLSWYRRIAR